MARNKYPEQTVDRILDVATDLFVEKGYDHTTIQDIIDHLGGLTKGAIYHHFKNKEEILMAAGDRLYRGQDEYFRKLVEREDLTGLQKIKELIQISLRNQGQQEMMSAAPDMKKSPHIFMMMFYDMQEFSLPIMQRIVEQGVADGSIQTEYPRQMAEVFLVLNNIWLNPLVMNCPEEELVGKFLFFKELIEGMGMTGIIEDSMLDILKQYQQEYRRKHD